MEVFVKAMHLVNFKKHQNLKVELQHYNVIEGANRSGKTTLVDAFLWTLFNKNAQGKSDFTVKPVDSAGNVIQKTEVSVTIELLVDYQPVTLKKVHREKWTKKKGSPLPEYTGNENLYFWNEVPLKENEYTAKIAAMIPESTFRMVTSTKYFHALKWQDRRQTLITLAGNISDRDVAGATPAFNDLIAAMAGKTFAEYKAEIASKMRLLKDNLERIPDRIDEVSRLKPAAQNWQELRDGIVSRETRITEIDKSFNDKAAAQNEKNKVIREANQFLHETTLKQIARENEIRNQFFESLTKKESAIRELKFNITTRQGGLNIYTTEWNQAKRDIERFQGVRDTKRKEWEEENASRFDAEGFSFDENETKCFACGQDLPAGTVQEKKAEAKRKYDARIQQKTTDFNKSKADALLTISNAGKTAKSNQEQTEHRATELKQLIEDTNVSIEEMQSRLPDLQREYEAAKNYAAAQIAERLANDAELSTIVNTITLTNKKIVKLQDSVSVEKDPALVSERIELQSQINRHRQLLADEQNIIKIDERIAELNRQQMEYANQLMELEGRQFTMLEFEKAKMDILESRINGMFRLVKFRLFDRQVNGAEVPCCDTLCNGAVWEESNTEFQINAGLDIISVISKSQGITAPIFIDNRESVTNIIDMSAQIINLKVDPEKPDLIVSYE